MFVRFGFDSKGVRLDSEATRPIGLVPEVGPGGCSRWKRSDGEPPLLTNPSGHYSSAGRRLRSSSTMSSTRVRGDPCFGGGPTTFKGDNATLGIGA